MNFKEYINTLKKIHFKNIILYIIGILVVGIISFCAMMSVYIEDINNQVNLSIEKYGTNDLYQLCKIANCNKIDIKNDNYEGFYITKNKTLILYDKKNNINNNYKHLYNNIYKYNNNLVLYNKNLNAYFVLDTNKLINMYLNVIIIFIPLSLLAFLLPFLKTLKDEKSNSMLLLAGNEALLSSKTMITIAENIHHELNTPLEVIDNKIIKIYESLDLETKNKLKKDFDYIKIASEQIYGVLSKMKEYKHLRYSNGNKTIKDIINGSFKIISLSNTNFEYKVDENLKDYKLNPNKIKNADLLSIMINHIKNSLEANATIIYVIVDKVQEKYIYIRIIDNGNGVPEHIKKDMFKPNLSSKGSVGDIRGNGMFLNKHIMKSASGDIRLIDTSSKGTTIELKVPIKY